MSTLHWIDCGHPACLEFRGPDALRYLNGQVTQDLRAIPGTDLALPACVTDAKGRFQFRVWISSTTEGALRVDAPAACPQSLEARLTRYLVADEVEVTDLTGACRLIHFTGEPGPAPAGVATRRSRRFGVDGTDWWIPGKIEALPPAQAVLLEGPSLAAWRVEHGVPAVGNELNEELLPPEAGLDVTDISYHKGCYIGQEILSRIKSAGKLNQRLVRLAFDAALPVDGLALVDADGREAGSITTISPDTTDGIRRALAFVKRGVDAYRIRCADGSLHPAAEA